MPAMSTAKIAVRVQARARRNEIVAVRDGALIVRVSAPALEGRANRAVCRLLADHLDIAPSKVAIIKGERSRDKLIEVQGLDQASAEAALSKRTR
jgi:hypothetical protein